MKRTPRNIAILLIVGLSIGGALGVSVALQDKPKERIVQLDMFSEPVPVAVAEPVVESVVEATPVTEPNKDDNNVISFVKEYKKILDNDNLNKRQRHALTSSLEADWEGKQIVAFVTFDDFDRSNAVFKLDNLFDIRCMDVSENNKISDLSPKSEVSVTGTIDRIFLDIYLSGCGIK